MPHSVPAGAFWVASDALAFAGGSTPPATPGLGVYRLAVFSLD